METYNVRVLDHPLVSELITRLRDVRTDSQLFRIHIDKISRMLLFDALSDLKTKKSVVPTQTGIDYKGDVIEEKVAFVAILRASLSMLNSAIDFYPNGEFHVIGMKRNEEDPHNKEPYFYLDKLDEMDKTVQRVIIMDPMLATGGSMITALKTVRQKHRFKGKIQVLAMIAAKPGAESIYKLFPDVTITCAGFDQKLNKHAYIIPGLGDAGDRYFGIKTDLSSVR